MPSCGIATTWPTTRRREAILPKHCDIGGRRVVRAIEDRTEEASSNIDPRGQTILPAVAQTVRDFHIPIETLLAVLDGVEMDLQPRVYGTFDELAVYCERVASAVGLACMHIWGFDGAAALPAGRSAGLALQLTNILRDLSEDARQGRVYLPQADLAACGYTVEDLRGGAVQRCVPAADEAGDRSRGTFLS